MAQFRGTDGKQTLHRKVWNRTLKAIVLAARTFAVTALNWKVYFCARGTLSIWDLDFRIRAGLCGIHSRHDPINVPLHHGPS